MKRLLAFMLALIMCVSIIPVSSVAAQNDLVIVLDPGHDDTHAGTQRKNNVGEEDLVLKIAQYCKEELEQYKDVTVYMTRESGACVNGGRKVTSAECNKKRVEFAAEKKADIYVSFHLNASESTKANGAGVYYPNSNYRPDLGKEGHELSEVIVDKLAALGLSKWAGGTLIRNSEDGTKYPDGSLADYLGIIRRSKEAGIPAVLIEHAFLSNDGDYNNFLNTDEKLKKLGAADAAAIAEYYNLSSEEQYKEGDAKLSVTSQDAGSKYQISAAEIPEAYGVRFAVWNQSGAETDKKWYTAVKDENGNWNATVPVSDFKRSGSYSVRCNIVRKNGTEYYIGETNFVIQGPTAKSFEIRNKDDIHGTWDAVIAGVTSQVEIETVEIAVWSQADQANLMWYTAEVQPDGTYIATIDIANHNYMQGTYHMHVYATDKNGICECVGADNIAVDKSSAQISITENDKKTVYTIYGSGIEYTGSKELLSVSYGVWSSAGGQDDLVWYDAGLNGNKQWVAEVDIRNHRTAGNYQVHGYANLKNGTSVYIGATMFEVSGPRCQGVIIENADNVSGRFDIKIKDIHSSSEIKMVEAAVWSTDDQSDLKWYTVEKDAEGNYKVEADIANHKYNYGQYRIHVYAQDENGISACIGGASVKLEKPSAKLEATANAGNTRYTITGSNIAYTNLNMIKSVSYGVWSSAGGQDDLVWYDAKLNGNKQWIAEVDIRNHRTAGNYQVHGYANLKNGTGVYIGATMFEVSGPRCQGVIVENTDNVSGRFDVEIKEVYSPAGIEKVEAAVWSADDQNDLKWYTVEKDAEGNYKVEADIANHKYNYGQYRIHVYAQDENGISACIGGASVKLEKPSAKLEATANAGSTRYTITGSNIAYTNLNMIKSVSYGVWSSAGGQDDLVWYDAKLNGNKQWVAEVDIRNHKTAGNYHVHTYVDLKDGRSLFAGATAFEVPGLRSASVEIADIDEANGTFQIHIEDLVSGFGIAQVQVAVWCEENQNDIVWYNATKKSDTEYIVYADIENHKKHLGVYKAHVYASDNAGIYGMVGGATCQMLDVPKGYFNIVGSSAVTKEQLMRYYEANEKYPAFYQNTDAPTLDVFCQMYLEECNAEGIKVEVAFCQAMKETGFLRYLGDAKIEQFNFAGLDTTGKKEDGTVDVGRSYPDVRTGIRAHVQRLKAWAVKGTTPSSYQYECIDADKFDSPWWVKTIIGSAPYVEWLGKYQNPSGYGWAVDPNYGYSIKNDYLAKLLSY